MVIDHVSPDSMKMPAAFHGAAEESYPSWMLLELFAYLEKVENATTAVSKTSSNKHIQITFCPRPPPLLSCFCNHSDANIRRVPHIVAMEDDLALLRVDVISGGEYQDYYVYQADDGSGKPSLTLLPRAPSDFNFYYKDIGMLGYRRPGSTGKEYIVAGFRFISFDYCYGGIALCLYDSKVGDWKVYDLSLSPQGWQEYGDKKFFHKICKVVTIGGDAGTMAFVDLWRGMLICDVLQLECGAARGPRGEGEILPLLGYVSLPDDLGNNAKLKGDARLYRDITFLDGHLKCVDLASRSLWVRPATARFSTGGWSQRYSIGSFREITNSNPGINLLPGQSGVDCRSFRGLLVCQPVIGLEDDDARILYFTVKNKMHQTDDQAWVVAVDMVSKKILGVAHFFQRNEMVNFTYVHSRLSKHLKNTAPGAQALLRQSGMVLQGSSRKMKDEAQERHADEFVAEDGDAMALD